MRLRIDPYKAGLCLLIAVILIILLMASTPPVDRDSLTHHLAVPKLYIKHGGIYEIPEIEFSYYPQLIDLIYLIPLYFNNDIFPKFLHFLFSLLTSLFVFKLLRIKGCNRFLSLMGGLFFLTTPLIVKLSVEAYVDLGLYFFSFISLYCLILWYRDDKINYLIYSAVACGFAMSCKYNGLITFFCMFFSVFWLASKKVKTTKRIFFNSALFCIISISVFSPWLIKNYIWTGNPVYPLYKNLFDHSFLNTTADNIPQKAMSHFTYRRIIYNETIGETILTPVRIFFCGKDDDPRFFDGVLNPFIFFMSFVCMVFVYLRYKKNADADHESTLLFLFSWVYILFVFFQTDMRIRWIGPSVAPLTVLSFLIIGRIFEATHTEKKMMGFKKIVLFSVIILSLNYNFIYIYNLFKKIDPISYLTGKITRDEYIQMNRSEYASYQYINSNLPQDAKIYGLYVGNRRYYCDRDIITNESYFRQCVKDAQSSDDISKKIKSIGITHFVIEDSMYVLFFVSTFSEAKQKLLSEFWSNNSKMLFSADGYSVYEIR